ncbi:MAG: DUF1772 domain-containing protein [Candidatus Hinthialibacter antarcticus]|nr:DUF1772 domain-containing protein [Candidatus Hinthialibacter antarcticus]
MTTHLLLIGCSIAALSCGLVAGIFLAFSDFIMRSLDAANPAAGIECMQLINRKVYRSIFMVLLMGMVPYSFSLMIFSFFYATHNEFWWTLAGGLTYFFGVILVTGVCNVPMNQRLDSMNFEDKETETYWLEYCRTWTNWNHIRTFFSVLSAIFYFIACLCVV